MIYLQDPDFTLYQGDALEVLCELPDESVHMCVTSPPFYGLRDYGTGTWEGGDEGCDHVERVETRPDVSNGQLTGTRGNQGATRRAFTFKAECGKCGARRVDRQIGLEATPDEWVAALVAVFREVRRVLRSDGTLWLEIGDSYNSGINGRQPTRDVAVAGDVGGWQKAGKMGDRRIDVPGLKTKDLIGAPWLLAFALRADGWYLRSDIIWARPNPMPESVRDRPTKSHSYVFLLSKSPRYFFDQEAVRETYSENTHSRGSVKPRETPKQTDEGQGIRQNRSFSQAIWGQEGMAPHQRLHPQEETLGDLLPEAPRGPDGRRQTHVEAGEFSEQHRNGERWPNGGRNIRSVWTIPTEPLPDEHYAAYPSKLVERCILAGTSERGCCPKCGAPWERVSKIPYDDEHPTFNEWRRRKFGTTVGQGKARVGDSRQPETSPQGYGSEMPQYYKEVWGINGSPRQTTGWRSSCGHDHEPVPSVCLDPFLGSGTTALVARKHGRRTIGIELSPDYCAMAARRLSQLSLLV